MKVAGFGFRGEAGTGSLTQALRAASAGVSVDALATASDKAMTPTFRRFAAAMDLPIVEIAADVLASQTTPTQSDASLHVRGAGSVAEAAALAGAGPDAKLVRPRVISLDRMATCAIAEGRGQ